MTGGEVALPADLDETVARALAEDIGPGDVTAELVAADRRAAASVVCREAAVLCGTPWLERVFARLDPRVVVTRRRNDGDLLQPGEAVCTLEGPARALLSGERVALNFLQTLSGTATLSRHYAEAVQGLGVRLLDTRKTVPGLRAMQKYAVACGGCHNHRQGLYDAVLIKENHIAVLGGVTAAVAAARSNYSDLGIEIEVETLEQLSEAIDAGADIVLLDNFPVDDLRRAVAMNAGRVLLEVSGGVTLETVYDIARTGVDRISVGALTKDVRAIDFSMRFEC